MQFFLAKKLKYTHYMNITKPNQMPNKTINWFKTFKHTVSFEKIKINASWEQFILNEMGKPHWKQLEKYLSHVLKKYDGNVEIYPYPKLVFSAFNITPLNKVKIVILGQDPYFRNELLKKKLIPQAMGLSFSVPKGLKIPSSLNNIYKNLSKFGHIEAKPTHGDLTSWAEQGCLMLNTSLTVKHGKKNGHSKYWKPFTDAVIKYVSDNTEHVCFILWGSNALSKYKFIDDKKHNIIISSHPSGLSCNRPLRSYEPFCNVDHFGMANKYLVEHEKQPIDFSL